MIIGGYNIPDLVLIIVAIATAGIIYYYLPEDIKAGTKKFLKGYFFWILIIGILIYGWNRWGNVSEHPGIADMKFAIFIVLALGIVYLAAKNWLYEHRYATNMFVANGVQGSCAKKFDMGRYTVFYLGTSGQSHDKGFNIPWYFSKKIAIVPKDAWDFNGFTMVSRTLVSKMEDIRVIPADIRRRIEGDFTTLFAREDIYFGLFSEEARTEDPSLNEIEQKLFDSNVYVNTAKDIIINKENTLKTHLTNQKAMADKITSSGSQARRVVQQGGED